MDRNVQQFKFLDLLFSLCACILAYSYLFYYCTSSFFFLWLLILSQTRNLLLFHGWTVNLVFAFCMKVYTSLDDPSFDFAGVHLACKHANLASSSGLSHRRPGRELRWFRAKQGSHGWNGRYGHGTCVTVRSSVDRVFVTSLVAWI